LALFWLFLLTALLVAALVYAPIRRYQRNRRLAAQPLPEQWQGWLRSRWWLYSHLPEAVRRALHRQLQVMHANTDFYGCNGLTVTEPMRVLTLAQAALMNTGSGRMQWSGFPAVLLYPEGFVREGEVVDELGLVAHQRQELLGESWEQGKVVLSWADIEQDLRGRGSHCLVIHEFAHQLDGYDGVMDGTPPMVDPRDLKRWGTVMQAAFEDLGRGESESAQMIDPYGGTEPEEFFAVISETFFTDPQALQEAYPEVYRLMQQFFRLNPVRWFSV